MNDTTINKHIHIIGIGGIGISALARYYHSLGYSVSGSDSADSPFLDTLREQGFEIFIGHQPSHLRDDTHLVIYSEAIITKPDLPPEEQIYDNPELRKARDKGIRHCSYPIALSEIFNTHRGIAIAGSHGKSTTTAMTSLMLANIPVDDSQNLHPISSRGESHDTAPGVTAIIGTQVPQLGNSNFYTEPGTENFVIEACEYKRSFLHYRPYITVITNIDLDHLDYYTSLEDYISAFQSLVDNTSGFVILSEDDKNSKKLIIPEEKRIIVGKEILYFPQEEQCSRNTKIPFPRKSLTLPKMQLQIPGNHILHDAHLAYAVGKILGMKDTTIIKKLESYRGSWRRSEIIRTTKNDNILMSDYGHHPNEIRPTLRAIKEKYPDRKLFVVFQPHQYSRTRQLLSEFATAFSDADSLIIPDIYFSRDKKEDVEWMTVERLVNEIRIFHPNVQNGEGLHHTLSIIREYDRDNPESSIILLLGAGNIDELRADIL